MEILKKLRTIFMPDDGLRISREDMAVVLNYQQRLTRCAPVVESEAGPAQECVLSMRHDRNGSMKLHDVETVAGFLTYKGVTFPPRTKVLFENSTNGPLRPMRTEGIIVSL